jgi:NTP pyrophosphatase (non-canonical NTP hydrolase)
MNNELIKKIIQFREERDWSQFHTIKDLCLGLGVEVSELQEIFLWKTDKEMSDLIASNKTEIENELADIFIFLSYLCYDLDVNIEHAVKNKLQINEMKYPIDKFKGSNKKYNSK